MCTPLMLFAQTDISAGVMYTWQSAPPPGGNPSTPTSGIGGTSAGATFGVGRMTRALPHLGWRTEFEVARKLDYQQANFREAGLRGYRTRGIYDDTSASILARFSVIQGRLEALTGFSIVHASLTRELAPAGVGYSALPNTSVNRAAVTFGADALFPIHSRFLIAPQVRLRVIDREDDPIFSAGSRQVRPAITARFQF